MCLILTRSSARAISAAPGEFVKDQQVCVWMERSQEDGKSEEDFWITYTGSGTQMKEWAPKS